MFYFESSITPKGNLKGKVSPWNQVMKIQIDALSEIDFLASKFRN